MEYRVYYHKQQDTAEGDAVAGSMTVTDTEVQLAKRLPLLPVRALMAILISGFILSLFSMILPFGMLYSQLVTDAFSAYPFPTWIFTIGFLILPGILLGTLPLRRQLLTLRCEEILDCTAQAREVWLRTATGQTVVTARTTADAQALSLAVRGGVETPCTRPVRYGRESLSDDSKYYEQKPVTLAIEDGMATLAGTAYPSGWRSFAAISVVLGSFALSLLVLALAAKWVTVWGMFGISVLVLACLIGGFIGMQAVLNRGKREQRVLPLSALRGITAIHRYLTFLAPDEKEGERRYTLQASSPEEAATLARRLQEEGRAESLQATCRLPNSSQERGQAHRALRRYLPDDFTVPGCLQVERDSVTFAGHSGLPHPWAWRWALLLAVIAVAALLPFFGQINRQFQLDTPSWAALTVGVPAMLALLFVYVPASALLSHKLGQRVTLPRRRISHVSCRGREVTLTITSLAEPRRYTLAAGDDASARALADALSTV